jgi:two-component system, chemotaxis family, protein-glutamate methylesterase/glutaminase
MPALTALLEQVSGALPAAVLVVQHLPPTADIEPFVDRLSRHTTLSCQIAKHGQPILPGNLYLAPPDRHLLVKTGRLVVTKGPHENSYRPAADALFRSVAVEYGPRAIGVVLTGMLHDGTAGLDFIKQCSGRAVVQDPHDAEYASMPESALRQVDVDYSVSIQDMGTLLEAMVREPLPLPLPISDNLRNEAAIAERVVGDTPAVAALGTLFPLTCPDCGGNLWRVDQGSVLRFRCHTGHAFTADALLSASQKTLEETLWVALRMMEERKNLLSAMATRSGGPLSEQQYERIDEIRQHVNRLREFLLNGASGGSNATTPTTTS